MCVNSHSHPIVRCWGAFPRTSTGRFSSCHRGILGRLGGLGRLLGRLGGVADGHLSAEIHQPRARIVSHLGNVVRRIATRFRALPYLVPPFFHFVVQVNVVQTQDALESNIAYSLEQFSFEGFCVGIVEGIQKDKPRPEVLSEFLVGNRQQIQVVEGDVHPGTLNLRFPFGFRLSPKGFFALRADGSVERPNGRLEVGSDRQRRCHVARANVREVAAISVRVGHIAHKGIVLLACLRQKEFLVFFNRQVFQAFPEVQVHVPDLFVVDDDFVTGGIERTLQLARLFWDGDGLVILHLRNRGPVIKEHTRQRQSCDKQFAPRTPGGGRSYLCLVFRATFGVCSLLVFRGVSKTLPHTNQHRFGVVPIVSVAREEIRKMRAPQSQKYFLL